MPAPTRDEDELLAVCDALEELAQAQGLQPNAMPALTRLREVAGAGKRRRGRMGRHRAWLALAAAFAEASNLSERMAGMS